MAPPMFSFQIDLPAAFELAVDEGRVLNAMGREGAKEIKKRIRKGQAADGPLPVAKDKKAKKPLRRSGQLLKSIRAGKPKTKRGDKSIEIFPHGDRADTGNERNRDRALNNFGLLAALQKNTAVGEVDVIGPNDAEFEAMADAAQAELAKQSEKRPLLVAKGGTITFKNRR